MICCDRRGFNITSHPLFAGGAERTTIKALSPITSLSVFSCPIDNNRRGYNNNKR